MIHSWLQALDAVQLATFARRYQTLARADGAFVILADGAEVAIPPLVTPAVIGAEMQRALANDARLLVSAIDRVARALVAAEESPLRARVLSSLSAFERAAMMRTYEQLSLATARVDFLVDTNGSARALEINTTIPAMQGYSDAVSGAFLRAVGEQRGVDEARIAAAIDKNGRNTDELLASLLALRGSTRPQRIALVARHDDSQGGELDHYVRRWSALGHHVVRYTPDLAGCAIDETDIFYRHIFLRRLLPEDAFTKLVLDPRKRHVWNPPATHLELKAMLGLLSMQAHDGVLTDDERNVVDARVPWTRVCVRGATRAPDGSAVADLIEFVAANPDQLVLKRSWDYGGRGVFLGAELMSESSQTKLRTLLGARDRTYSWTELVAHVAEASEAWVVQTLVDVRPRPYLRLDDRGVVSEQLYADISAFTSLGNEVDIGGGAVRASKSRIVNIQGGGGLVPLLREEAVALLF